MGIRAWSWVAVLALGCGSNTVADDDDGGAGGSGASAPQLFGVDGVSIQRVSLYQGVERPLAIQGAQQPSDVPLISGRPALVRVFYDAPAVAGTPVVGRIELADGSIMDAPAVLAPSSVDGDLATTVNFFLEGEAIAEPFSYRVSIMQEAEGPAPTGVYQHPVAGLESHQVAGGPNKLRVVLVPFQYQADGSGRLPNTSPEQVEVIRNRFRQLYPVSDVEVTVRAPVPWSQPIAANGQGWQEVGIELFQIRQAEAPSPDHYYYGIFNPADSLPQFCGTGCLLGVTLLNDMPADVGNEQLRLALGVGFDAVAADTAAHEVGHAHGRAHANCGPGLDPQSIDPGYPHAGGLIGTWGYDIVTQTMVDPAVFSDIMGYCNEQWISDYNFKALFARGSLVNQPHLSGVEPEPHVLMAIDGEGDLVSETAVSLRPFFGPAATVTVREGAVERAVEGHWFGYDHLPGGWLIVPAG